MRWPGASPRRKRSANCAICWMYMKGAGDDSDELGFPQRDAIFGMGSVALSLAGNCSDRSGRGCDGVVPPRVGPLSVRRRGTGADVAGSVGDFLLLFAAAFRCRRNREVVAARCCSLDDSEERNRGASLDSTFLHHAVAGCASMAGRG